MPKSKKTKRKRAYERENWSWSGFVFGGFIGAVLYLIAIGYYYSNPLIRSLSQVIVLIVFFISLPLTLLNFWRRKAVVSPLFDGTIAGFGFSMIIVDLLLNRIRFF